MQIFIDYNGKKPTQMEAKELKVIQIVGLIAESPCGIWMQMSGVSQSLLVTNGRIRWGTLCKKDGQRKPENKV